MIVPKMLFMCILLDCTCLDSIKGASRATYWPDKKKVQIEHEHCRTRLYWDNATREIFAQARNMNINLPTLQKRGRGEWRGEWPGKEEKELRGI